MIFIIYAVQRGFATIAKSGMAPDFFSQSMSIYFTTMSLAVLAGGFLIDRFKPKTLVYWATFAGCVGIGLIDNTAWGFGLLFGAAAAMFKLLPYSNPLKRNTDLKTDAQIIAPQAAAKNFGGAAFLLFLGALVAKFSLSTFAGILGMIFMVLGIYLIYTIPDDRIPGWKIDEIKELIKRPRFWQFCAYCFLMCGFYYLAVMGFFPAMLKAGFTKANTITILAVSYLFTGLLRWPVAWMGRHYGYWKMMVIGTIGMAGCYYLTPVYPLAALILFVPFSAIHTPNYWAWAKFHFGRKYLATVVGLGFVAMYLGAGVMFGKW